MLKKIGKQNEKIKKLMAKENEAAEKLQAVRQELSEETEALNNLEKEYLFKLMKDNELSFADTVSLLSHEEEAGMPDETPEEIEDASEADDDTLEAEVTEEPDTEEKPRGFWS